MIDAHAHVHDKQFDEDRDAVMRRAFDSGVKRMIMIGTDVEESGKAVALSEKYAKVWAAVGVHPHDCNQQGTVNKEQQVRDLAMLLQNKKVIAIGEIGLDYYAHSDGYITEKQKECQRKGFLVQMTLAQKHNLPVIIHTRPSSQVSDDAYEDLLHLLVTTHHSLPAILHCYQGGKNITREFLKLPNVYFSFAGSVTYPVKQELRGTEYDVRKVVQLVPRERMLIETDCPYLAPQPLRGRRNEPAFVRYTYEWIADLKDVPLKVFESRVEKNFDDIFGKRII